MKRDGCREDKIHWKVFLEETQINCMTQLYNYENLPKVSNVFDSWFKIIIIQM